MKQEHRVNQDLLNFAQKNLLDKERKELNNLLRDRGLEEVKSDDQTVNEIILFYSSKIYNKEREVSKMRLNFSDYHTETIVDLKAVSITLDVLLSSKQDIDQEVILKIIEHLNNRIKHKSINDRQNQFENSFAIISEPPF